MIGRPGCKQKRVGHHSGHRDHSFGHQPSIRRRFSFPLSGNLYEHPAAADYALLEHLLAVDMTLFRAIEVRPAATPFYIQFDLFIPRQSGPFC
jgi:hypothetical protein